MNGILYFWFFPSLLWLDSLRWVVQRNHHQPSVTPRQNNNLKNIYIGNKNREWGEEGYNSSCVVGWINHAPRWCTHESAPGNNLLPSDLLKRKTLPFSLAFNKSNKLIGIWCCSTQCIVIGRDMPCQISHGCDDVDDMCSSDRLRDGNEHEARGRNEKLPMLMQSKTTTKPLTLLFSFFVPNEPNFRFGLFSPLSWWHCVSVSSMRLSSAWH